MFPSYPLSQILEIVVWGDVVLGRYVFYYVPTIYTHRIHVWNICIHLPNKNQPKVDKCVSYMDPVISRWETNSKEQYTQTTSKWSYFTPFLWRVFHNPIETHLFWAIYRGYPCPSICNFPRSGPTICMSVSWIWKAKKTFSTNLLVSKLPRYQWWSCEGPHLRSRKSSCGSLLLGQRLNFKRFGITFSRENKPFKLLFQGPLAKWVPGFHGKLRGCKELLDDGQIKPRIYPSEQLYMKFW